MARPRSVPTLTTDTAMLTVPRRTAKLAVIADTHSAPHAETLRHLIAMAPDAILHAGDIGSLDVLDRFRAVAPLFAVRGNIDARVPGIPDELVLDVTCEDRKALRILLLHIAVAGPRLRADVAKRARAAGASLVVCGHSHVPFMAKDRDLAVFNPGSVGPRRFLLPIVFGVIDVGETGVRLAHVDCETGAPWLPPVGPLRERQPRAQPGGASDAFSSACRRSQLTRSFISSADAASTVSMARSTGIFATRSPLRRTMCPCSMVSSSHSAASCLASTRTVAWRRSTSFAR